MKKGGFDDRTIMKISGHKTAKSLENYDPSNSIQRKTEMAAALLGAPEQKSVPAEPKERRVLVPNNQNALAEEKTPTTVNLVATQAFHGFGTQVVKPTEDTSMEDTTGEEEAEVPSEHEVSGVPTSDDSMNDSREDGWQGPLTQVATTSAIPPQMIGSKYWPQFAANQSQVNYNMSLTFMGQMFGQMSKMSDHVMDMNSKLLAQNNALVKKLLQDDKKKQDNDTKNEDDSWLDEL